MILGMTLKFYGEGAKSDTVAEAPWCDGQGDCLLDVRRTEGGLVLRQEPYPRGDWPNGRGRRSKLEGGPGRGVAAQSAHDRAVERPPRGQQELRAGIKEKRK